MVSNLAESGRRDSHLLDRAHLLNPHKTRAEVRALSGLLISTAATLSASPGPLLRRSTHPTCLFNHVNQAFRPAH